MRWSQSFQMRNYWWQRLMEHYIGQKTMYSWPTIMMMTETRNFLSFFSWWHRQTKFFFLEESFHLFLLGHKHWLQKVIDNWSLSSLRFIHLSLSHSLQVKQQQARNRYFLKKIKMLNTLMAEYNNHHNSLVVVVIAVFFLRKFLEFLVVVVVYL